MPTNSSIPYHCAFAGRRQLRALRHEGRKKVSDYLTDRKFSLLRKERQWVLCCGDDIIWLVGERVDNRFRMNEKTRKVLVVSTIDQ